MTGQTDGKQDFMFIPIMDRELMRHTFQNFRLNALCTTRGKKPEDLFLLFAEWFKNQFFPIPLRKFFEADTSAFQIRMFCE